MANLPTNDAFPELKKHAAFNTSKLLIFKICFCFTISRIVYIRLCNIGGVNAGGSSKGHMDQHMRESWSVFGYEQKQLQLCGCF